MTKRIDVCQHRDFYHWRDESRQSHHGRHDHMCFTCPLRISYYSEQDQWEIADMQASLREEPYVFTQDETQRAYHALAAVTDRKRLSAPFVAPRLAEHA